MAGKVDDSFILRFYEMIRHALPNKEDGAGPRINKEQRIVIFNFASLALVYLRSEIA